MARITTKSFIERSIEIYGIDKYDFSKSIIDKKNPITITCSNHGDFMIKSPYNFLKGHGCKQCGIDSRSGKLRSTKDNFTHKAILTHGGKYSYNNVEYINCDTKVLITCSDHGDFLQRPVDHIKGHGCIKCGGSSRSNTLDFIQKSLLVHTHGNYDYSKVEYKNAKTKVLIICPIHGDFEIKPNDHLMGVGSKDCGYIKSANTRSSNFQCTSLSDIEKYRRKVRSLSNKNYNKFKDEINPNNFPRNKDYHLDHKVSIIEGFLNNIPEEIISHPVNLEIVDAKANRSKSFKSSMEIEELYEKYNSSIN